MSDKNVLKASIREKVTNNTIEIPAELYGFQVENKSVKLNRIEFEKFFKNVGESKIFDLIIDEGESIKVIVKSIQRDAVKDAIIHVDFYQINMDRKIQVRVPFEFVGESKAVKEKGALLITSMKKVMISCLPGDLMESIKIDISKFENFSDSYKLFDLDLGDKIEIASKTNDPIIGVMKPKKIVEEEVEVAKPKEGADAEEKKEGEEEAPKEEKKD